MNPIAITLTIGTENSAFSQYGLRTELQWILNEFFAQRFNTLINDGVAPLIDHNGNTVGEVKLLFSGKASRGLLDIAEQVLHQLKVCGYGGSNGAMEARHVKLLSGAIDAEKTRSKP